MHYSHEKISVKIVSFLAVLARVFANEKGEWETIGAGRFELIGTRPVKYKENFVTSRGAFARNIEIFFM
jgi:hypothetical protein